jgi:hypothetical protein
MALIAFQSGNAVALSRFSTGASARRHRKAPTPWPRNVFRSHISVYGTHNGGLDLWYRRELPPTSSPLTLAARVPR